MVDLVAVKASIAPIVKAISDEEKGIAAIAQGELIKWNYAQVVADITNAADAFEGLGLINVSCGRMTKDDYAQWQEVAKRARGLADSILVTVALQMEKLQAIV